MQPVDRQQHTLPLKQHVFRIHVFLQALPPPQRARSFFFFCNAAVARASFFFLAEIAQLWEHQPLSPSQYGLLPFSEPLALASGSVASISIATSHPHGLILRALQPGLVCSIEV